MRIATTGSKPRNSETYDADKTFQINFTRWSGTIVLPEYPAAVALTSGGLQVQGTTTNIKADPACITCHDTTRIYTGDQELRAVCRMDAASNAKIIVIAAKVYYTTFPNAANEYIFFYALDKTSGGTPVGGLGLRMGTNRAELCYRSNDVGSAITVVANTATLTGSENQWLSLFGVFDLVSLAGSIYLDGQLNGSGTAITGTLPNLAYTSTNRAFVCSNATGATGERMNTGGATGAKLKHLLIRRFEEDRRADLAEMALEYHRVNYGTIISAI